EPLPILAVLQMLRRDLAGARFVRICAIEAFSYANWPHGRLRPTVRSRDPHPMAAILHRDTDRKILLERCSGGRRRNGSSVCHQDNQIFCTRSSKSPLEASHEMMVHET